MALANGLSGILKSAGAPNLGSLLQGSTKRPVIDRYHSSGEEYHGWTKSKSSKKNNIALSALTLLAFLFFLNILQNCLQEHIDDMKGKGKGVMMMQAPATQMQMVAAAREGSSQKGDLGDSSLEIDDLTILAEDRIDGGKKKRRKNGQGNKNNNNRKKNKNIAGSVKGDGDLVLEKVNTFN